MEDYEVRLLCLCEHEEEIRRTHIAVQDKRDYLLSIRFLYIKKNTGSILQRQSHIQMDSSTNISAVHIQTQAVHIQTQAMFTLKQTALTSETQAGILLIHII